MWYTRLKSIALSLIAIINIAINDSHAQSYYHSPGDTIMDYAVIDDGNVYMITQVHPTPDTLHFKWYKQSVSLPSGWNATICDNGNCYTSLADSGMMIPIVPGDNGLMMLKIYPNGKQGVATIRYRIFSTVTPDQVDTLT